MKPDIQRIFLAAVPALLLVFILYIIKIIEIGMEIDLSQWGVYPLQWKGCTGILFHPLIHSGFKHLFANTLPLLFLSWCLFYFYKDIAVTIFLSIWIGAGILTFCIGKPGWHIGASGIIYGLAFFLFFSGLLRKYIPLIAISLLVTFLYGGIVWQMSPHFTAPGTSWEGHLSGAIAGSICAFLFLGYGPQKPIHFAEEEEVDFDYGKEEDLDKENSIQSQTETKQD